MPKSLFIRSSQLSRYGSEGMSRNLCKFDFLAVEIFGRTEQQKTFAEW